MIEQTHTENDACHVLSLAPFITSDIFHFELRDSG